MFTATLRGMLAHKVRLVLTVASIALGVAFLAGTLVLTDTMHLAFNQLFGKVSAGTDAVVRAEAAYSQSEGISTSRGPIPAAVLTQVSKADGVRTAEGSVSGYALLTDNGGRAVLTSGGAPTMGYSMPADPALRGDVKILTGTAPSGAHQVAIDATSAEEHHIALGSTIKVLFNGPAEKFTVVGTVGFGGEKNLGGTTGAYFDSATAQKVLGAPGLFDSINVSADPGVAPADLVQRITTVLPDGAEAVTGATVVKESADAVNKDLKVVTVLFMIFAGIALFVGSFIIWNTFTMTITQRSREIALLRAIGATRRQVNRSLVLEALLLGIVASAVGIGLGLLVAKGLNLLMDAVGFSLPSTSMQVEPRTIVVSLLVGTVVTVVAALVPAYRATKVLPVEALREAVPGSGNPTKKRIISGAVVTVVGLTGLFLTLYSRPEHEAVRPQPAGHHRRRPHAAAGCRPSARVADRRTAAAAWPARRAGPAERDAQPPPYVVHGRRPDGRPDPGRQHGRVRLVAEGVVQRHHRRLDQRRPVRHSVEQAGSGLQPRGDQGGPGRVRGRQGLRQRLGSSPVRRRGFELLLGRPGHRDRGAEPAVVGRLGVRTSAPTGSWWRSPPRRRTGGRSATPSGPSSPQTGKHTMKVVGIYDSKGWISDDFVISIAAQTAAAGPQLITSGLVTLVPGADRSTVQQAITAALADHPDAKVLDRKGFEKEASGFIDKLLTFVTVMLLLAVMIALLGIVNTLVLSVFERTRELGLLRAVGMTRAQVRAMVRWESVVISLIGALAGAALGIGLGLALSQALADEGIKAISIPGLQVALYVVLAAVAGVLAAVGPARSAAKVDVLKAVVAD